MPHESQLFAAFGAPAIASQAMQLQVRSFRGRPPTLLINYIFTLKLKFYVRIFRVKAMNDLAWQPLRGVGMVA